MLQDNTFWSSEYWFYYCCWLTFCGVC